MQHEEPYALIGHVRFRRGAWAGTPMFTQERRVGNKRAETQVKLLSRVIII